MASETTTRAACIEIARGGESIFKWEWDNRFQAALTIFKKPDMDYALNLLERTFEEHWTFRTDHPPAAKQIISSCGNLQPGQHLFLTSLSEPEVLAAMVWPWGNGQTVSLRLRLVKTGLDLPEQRERLLTWVRLG